MRLPWRNAEAEGVFERLLWAPLWLPAAGYALAACLDRAWQRRGRALPIRVDARVLSVGALTAGGAGKTPLAAWLARRLQARGTKVALLTRGYRRQRGAPVTVASDGQSLLASASEVGDEAHWLARQAPGVPVVVAPDRVQGARRAIALYGADLLVLDDGFQHHRLARDLDIVAIDTDFGLGNGRRLPRGPLRESPTALGRAGMIAWVGGGPPEARLEARVDAVAPSIERFRARRVPRSLRRHDGGLTLDPSVLRGMQVGMLAGIAQPASFRATLEALGAHVTAQAIFRDHHRYRARDLRSLARRADIWVTTEKDAGKIRGDWVRELDLRVLGIEIEVETPLRVLEAIEARLDLRQPAR